MWSQGFLTVARVRGVPVRFHWTTPLCAFLIGRLEFVPYLWAGYLALVLLHELGHAAVVRYHGLEVESIDVHGLGGLCRWSGRATPVQRATIAWGGVWAQLVLLAAAHALLFALGPPTSAALAQLADVATRANLYLIAINLIPLPPLDGAEAWPLLRILWERRRRRGRPSRPTPVRRLIAVPRDVLIHDAARREEEARLALAHLDDDDAPVSPEALELLERAREIAAREAEAARIAKIDRKEP